MHPVVSSIGNTSPTSCLLFGSYATFDLIIVASSDSHTCFEQFIFVRYSASSLLEFVLLKFLVYVQLQSLLYNQKTSVFNYMNGLSNSNEASQQDALRIILTNRATSGVPAGWRLSSILFNVYIDDIAHRMTHYLSCLLMMLRFCVR